MKIKILIASVVLIGAFFAISFATRDVAKIAKVKRGKAVSAVPGSVIVQAEYEVLLKSEIGGRIIVSNLEPGRSVKKGEILIQTDTGDIDLEIERVTSELESAKQRIKVGSQIQLELESAKETLENYERVTRLGGYPEAELVKRRREVRQIEQKRDLEEVANKQQVEGLETMLKAKKYQREKMTITAPFDGIISNDVRARPGALIGPNDPIASLIATTRTVEAKVSEEYFSGIKLGQTASVRFLGYGDKTFNAVVTKIMPTADPTTQRYVVHINVDIDAQLLVPGLTGELSIVVGEHENALIVPRRAAFGQNLYVVKDGKVHLQKIEIGFTGLNELEVLQGVSEGDQVIVEQLDIFRDGDKVRAQLAE